MARNNSEENVKQKTIARSNDKKCTRTSRKI